jgi:hypothetical protein
MNKDEFDAIKQLVASHKQLAKQAANALKIEVDTLICKENNDFMHIERLLDYLLDVACIPEGLMEFEKLCRYYFQLNPKATQEYVHAFRKMWDVEESDPTPTLPLSGEGADRSTF